MKKIKNYLLLPGLFIVGLAAILFACADEEGSNEKYYYTSVRVELAALPGASDMEVWFNEEKIGNVTPGTSGAYSGRVLAGSGTLAVYVKETGRLVADTMLTLTKNDSRSFRIADSPELGIAGWISSEPVSPDSVSVQFLNNLGGYYEAYPALDLHIFYYSSSTGEFLETGWVVEDFSKQTLTQESIKLSYADIDSNPIFYLGKLKNTETGEFLIQPNGSDWFLLEQTGSGGTAVIYNLTDTDGDVLVTIIYL